MKLTTTNWKVAGVRSYDLDAHMLIAGPNGSGKSAIQDALRFLFLGCVPTVGKREADTMRLVVGDKASVSLAFGDKVATRTIERRGSKTTTKAECSWIKGATPSDHAKALLNLVGQSEDEVAELLDVRELIRLPPNQRAQRIEKLIGSGASSPEQDAEGVVKAAAVRIAKIAPDRVPEKLSGVFANLKPVESEAFNAAMPMLVAKLRASVPEALAWANGEKRDRGAEHAQKASARDELFGRLAAIPAGPDTEMLQNRLRDMQRQVGALREGKQHWEGQERQRRVLAGRVDDLKHRHVTASVMLATAAGVAESAAKRLGLAIELRRQARALPIPTRPNLSAADKMEDEARTIFAEARAITVMSVPTDALELDAYTRANDALRLARDNPWNRVAVHVAVLATCELSPIASEAVDAINKIVSEQAPMDADEAEMHVKNANAALVAKRDEIGRVTTEQAGVVCRKLALDSKARRLDADARALRTEKLAEFDRAGETYRKQISAVESEATEIEAKARNAAKDEAAARAEVDSVVSTLRESESSLALLEAPTPEPPSADERERDIIPIQAALEQAARLSAMNAEFAAMIAGCDKAMAARDVFAAIEWALQRLREQKIGAGGGLLGAMTAFLDAGGFEVKPYIDADKGRVEIGWESDGMRVSVEALSGGEFIAFTTGLTAAMLSLSKAPLKFLLVEAAECDEGTLACLLDALHGLSGVTCIVARPNFGGDTEGWNEIALDGIGIGDRRP